MGRHIRIVEDTERCIVTVPGYDSQFTIRRLHPDAAEAIEAKYRRSTKNKRTGQEFVEVPIEDRPEQNKDLWDHIIVEWADVVDGQGEAVACTRDKKWALPGSVKAVLLEHADEGNLSGLRVDGAGRADPIRA